MPKLISLIIPTRNRPDYLVAAVDLARHHCQDIEVVVCDNSDTDSLRQRLATAIDDGSVVYRYSAEQLSVVDNFERARRLATGHYLMFIGDDDGIGPGLHEVATWALDQDVDAVVSYQSAFIANYFWPGVASRYFGNAYSASLFVRKFSAQASKIDCKAALRGVAQRFGGGLGALPRAYHGLVSKSLLDRIADQYGSVFGGISPDIYSATLITAECRNAWWVDYPFVIPGASPTSTAGQGAARSDKGELHQTDHITRFGSQLQWNPLLPAFYAPQTVWAYSLQAALDKVPQLKVAPDHGRLYARCLLFHRRHASATVAAMRLAARHTGWVRVLSATGLGLVAELAAQSWRLLSRVTAPRAGGHATHYTDVTQIGDAYAVLSEHILKTGRLLALGRPT